MSTEHQMAQQPDQSEQIFRLSSDNANFSFSTPQDAKKYLKDSLSNFDQVCLNSDEREKLKAAVAITLQNQPDRSSNLTITQTFGTAMKEVLTECCGNFNCVATDRWSKSQESVNLHTAYIRINKQVGWGPDTIKELQPVRKKLLHFFSYQQNELVERPTTEEEQIEPVYETIATIYFDSIDTTEDYELSYGSGGAGPWIVGIRNPDHEEDAKKIAEKLATKFPNVEIRLKTNYQKKKNNN